jgi:SAM-dependent methyltransferase
MYSGFSKNNGSVIGDTSKGITVDIREAQESTAAEESLVCMNEEGEEIILNAIIDTETGNLTWRQLLSKELVMSRTVGMSQMTSMMRDADRNVVYEKAIKLLIDNFVAKKDRAPVVLDVGAGTGLLSMFAARSGAEFVIGVEMFETMATIAERVVSANDLGDKILIVNAKSSEIEGLPVLPDLLISELLDSALLGEGCMPAHTDALTRLMSEPTAEPVEDMETEANDAGDFWADRVLPYSGAVYATLVQSAEVKHMHDTGSIALAGGAVHAQRTPAEANAPPCKGGWHLVPVHWAEMLKRGSKELSAQGKVLHANFALTECDAAEQYTPADTWQYSDITVESEGVVHGVLLWWTLYLLSPTLDACRECTYSTAPGAQNWQDHWQQTIYPLPEDIAVQKGDVVRVYAMHDTVHIQLYAEKIAAASSEKEPDSKRARQGEGSIPPAEQMVQCSELPEALQDDCRNLCMCGWHVLCGAERMQMMCDATRGEAWGSAIASMIDALPDRGVVLDLSDGSLLGLAAAEKLRNAGKDQVKVVSKETKAFSRLFYGQVADANGLDESVLVWDGTDLEELADFVSPAQDDEGGDNEKGDADQEHDREVDMSALGGCVVGVASECYYYQTHALPPWQALSFHFQLQALRRDGLLHPDCRILPGKALVCVVALELPQLRRCHGFAGV